ncbi:DNA polymerase I [Desulfonatronum thiosulfatophilum]|uniref:DNA polymerase I n=1 Tax=Desulfonatronum thiosulfatophilum TaxID=617002 RepID=A0A1G6B9B0_9BACT|nr:DNA polymerase I [Desulfonatronum thiosulfatophilum]SDB17207.1 DNA polymerase I [Desulfonatronum thiosulfatophilum]
MSLKSRLNLNTDPIFLIDGTSFLYRAFYAFPDLKRSDGFPTNALFIVLRLLLRLQREENPEFAGFFLDGRGATFRHELFTPYKAQRQSTPEGLVQQIEPLVQGVRLFGLTTQISEGVEADDLIASLCSRFKSQRPVIIVGSDKDLLQCLDANVFLWDPGLKNEKLVSKESFQQEHGLDPRQWPDYQALVGDSSDNIPGVPGVGPKTAKALMQRFPTLEALRDNFSSLLPKERKKIEPSLEDLFIYRELTRLRTDLQPEARIFDYQCKPHEGDAFRNFLRTYEFRSLEREILALTPHLAGSGDLLRPRTAKPLRPVGRPKAVQAVSSAIPESGALHDEAQRRVLPLEELPDLGSKTVSVLRLPDGWGLGLGDQELLWTGPTDALIAAAKGSDLVAAHSWKDLLAAEPSWTVIDMARRFDVSLAAYLLQPEERDYAPAALARRYQHELAEEASPANPAQLILQLTAVLQRSTAQAGFEGLVASLEMPLIPVLVDMERSGVLLDQKALRSFLDEVQATLAQLSCSICEKAGKEFNLRSSQQLAEVLFQRLGLKTGRKTPGGSRSTNVEILEKLAGEHPIVPEILEYRKLEKLRSTYLEPLPKLMDREGRVHTTFNQLAVATGRLSSSNPNLQNIPIRGPLGMRMRACFTAPEGHQLISADYSQIELRVLAHLSEDPHLRDLFTRGVDVHAGTAAILFVKDPDQVTADERRKAKTINFGLLYGMGPQKLGRDLGIGLQKAKEFIALYFMRLQKVRDFYEHIVAQAKEQGAVFTLAGRRRILPDINSRNDNMAQTARRMAINTVVQGSAADIIKMAMIRVHHDEILRELRARMVLQVHDELLLEVPTQSCREAGARVADLMATVVNLDVPLVVDWGCGPNWATGHD